MAVFLLPSLLKCYTYILISVALTLLNPISSRFERKRNLTKPKAPVTTPTGKTVADPLESLEGMNDQ